MHHESNTKDDGDIYSKRIVKGTVVSNCKQCHEDYTQPACRAKRDKFCSKSCGNIFKSIQKAKLITVCPFCEIPFIARSTQLAKDRKPYCSISCGSKSQERTAERYEKCNETRIKNAGNHNYPQGDQVHNWKGGKAISNGYVNIFVGIVKGKRKYILEHRLVMEMEIGRALLDSEIVHHINEIKDDNNIENLQIMSRSEHAKHHGSIRKNTKKTN